MRDLCTDNLTNNDYVSSSYYVVSSRCILSNNQLEIKRKETVVAEFKEITSICFSVTHKTVS